MTDYVDSISTRWRELEFLEQSSENVQLSFIGQYDIRTVLPCGDKFTNRKQLYVPFFSDCLVHVVLS